MLPVALDLSMLSIALIGRGEKHRLRHEQLLGRGARNVTLFDESTDLTADLVRQFRLILGVELSREEAARIAVLARTQGVLVNMEDQPEYCDFHYASFIARGDLLISVHSGGKSPALTQRIRNSLASLFPDEWAERLDRLSAMRLLWKKQGDDSAEITQKSNQMIDKEGWLTWKTF